MLRIRNDQWKHDPELRECLKTYVARSLKRHEIIDLVQDKFHEYSWSLGSLDRRMAFWGIKYIDNTIDISRLRNVIQEELQAPGRLLSQKAMHQKVRQIHHLNVPRDLVCSVMQELLDDCGLDKTDGAGKPKRPRRKRNFHSEHFVNGQQDPTSAPHYSQVTRSRQPRKTRSKVSKKSKTSRVCIKSAQVEDETSEENTSNSKMIQTENIVEAATDVLSSRISRNKSVPTFQVRPVSIVNSSRKIPFHNNSSQPETNDVKTFHQCVVCDEIFEEYRDLEVHNRIHVKLEKTDDVEENIDSIIKLHNIHVKVEKTDDVENIHKSHAKVDKNNDLDGACSVNLEHKITNVENHSKIHVKKEKIDGDKITDIENKSKIHVEEEKTDHNGRIHECNLCEKKFELYTDLEEHCKIHIKEEGTTECTFHEICYKTVKQEIASKNTNPSLEEKSVHPCVNCGKMFSMKKTEPQKLVKRKRKKVYKCHVCHETFAYYSSLKEHTKTHGPFKCHVCGDFFSCSSDIHTHMKDVHGAFICHICEKMFVDSTDIEDHMRSHSTFNCEVCSQLFTVFPDLYIHIKKSHRSTKPFKCDVCDKSYTHLTNLKLHYEVYDDMKPFMCFKCRKSFNCECNFEIHSNNCKQQLS